MSCWTSYVRDASKDTHFLDLQCPAHKCTINMMRSDLRRILPCLLPKWDDAILHRFINEDPSYRYCPGPDCSCVAVVSNASTKSNREVKCDTCSTSFCFNCGNDNHAPASCQDVEHWNRLKGSSQFWIKQNSKP